jgi:hypothetical protein
MCDGERMQILMGRITRLEEEREILIFNITEVLNAHKDALARLVKMKEDMDVKK